MVNASGLHQLLGAYLLGGLDAVDLKSFEDHLQECPQCRDELARLETVPMLLDAVPVPDAVALTAGPSAAVAAPSTAAPVALLSELARRRRKVRRRWAALAGAVAAACLAVGLAVGPLLGRAPQPDASYSVQSGGGLQFSIDLARKTWGTELAVNGSSLPSDGTLSLWVRDRAGGEDRACAWTATPSGRVKVTGATPIQLGSISSVELRDGTQQTVAVITVP
ncbi:Putative zinc-finger [Arthrobacter sp. OV608]|nr:Putative zinc-finger [Arthrobacter sp. OV608]